MKIVLCGGGTCGHIMPNIALLPYLKEKFDGVSYFGGGDSMEERIAEEYSIPFYSTKTIKLERKKIWLNLRIPFVLHSAEQEAKELLKAIKPDVVFSKGGYAALPTCLASSALGIPYIIHESDSTLGVANKITASKAYKVLLTEKAESMRDNYEVIGNPIRDEIVNGSRSMLKIRLDKNKKTVLIVGGSLGAMAINLTVEKALPALTERYNVIHIHGKSYCSSFKGGGYYPYDFVGNIGDYYDAADVIVSRAGAGAIAEINAVGKRAVYIPLPKGSSRGDQEENAARQAELKRADVIAQDALTPEALSASLEKALSEPAPEPLYDVNTARKIAEILYNAAKGKR